MKKNLLSALAICGILFTANAQNFTNGDTGYLIDYSGTNVTNANCLSGLTLPNNGGVYTATGGNITNVGEVQDGVTSEKYLKFTNNGGTDGTVYPMFYDIYSSQSGSCNSMRSDNVSIDMSSHPTLSIRAKSDVNGAVLRVWIGTYGSTTYSTYNTGSGASIPFDVTLTTSWADYNINLSTAGGATWSGWNGTTGCNCQINMLGFTTSNANANFMISQVGLGSMSTSILSTTNAVLPSSVKYYPNPSSSVINVDNMNVSSLKLINVNGTVVKEATTSSISVEGLTSGMYFLQINNYKPVKVAVK